MVPASILLVILVVTAPFGTLVRSEWWLGVQIILASVGTLTTIGNVASREGAHWLRVVRPILWLSGLALLFIVVQLLPLSFLAHPVWASAAEALRTPLGGHASVDLGASVGALAHVVLWALVAVLAAGVLIDRWRAEWALALLAGSASFTAVLCIVGSKEPETWAAAGAAAALGLLAAASFAYLAIERWETRHTRHAHAARRLGLAMGGALLAAVACGLVLVASGEPSLYAAGGGVVLLAGIIGIRRLGIGTYVGSFLGLLVLGFSGFALAKNMPPDASLDHELLGRAA